MGRYDRQEKKSSSVLIIIIVVIISVLAGLFFLTQDDEQSGQQTQETLLLPEQPPQIEPPLSNNSLFEQQNPDPAPSTDTSQPENSAENIEDATAEEQTEPLPPLPALEESDEVFRADLLSLSPGLSNWLNTERLIRKLVVISNDFSQGLRLHKHMRYFTLSEPFKVGRDRHGLYLDTTGYQRYNQLVNAIQALDINASIALYQQYQPLFQEVFAEFGYPEGHQMEDLLSKSSAEILEAPLIYDRISLYRPSVRYKFSSPKLESLSPVQKQMIRMGPKNTKIIQDKVRLLIEALINQPDNNIDTLG